MDDGKSSHVHQTDAQEISSLLGYGWRGGWGYQAGTRRYDDNALWFRSVPCNQPGLLFLLLAGFAIAIWKLLHTPAKPKLYYGLAIAVYFTLISLVFSGQSRHHFPVMPFVIAHAAWIGSGILRIQRRVPVTISTSLKELCLSNSIYA